MIVGESIETVRGQTKVACSQERIGSLPCALGRVENTRYGDGSAGVELRLPLTTS